MPLDYFRRPLALAAVSYMLLLAMLKAWGLFRLDCPPAWRALAYKDGLRLAGVVVSQTTENHAGRRLRARFDRGPGPPAEGLLYLPRGYLEELRPGRRMLVAGRLRLARSPRLPGEFDEKGFCDDRGLAFIFHAKGIEALQGPIPVLWKPAAWAEAVHQSIHRTMAAIYPAPRAALIEGIMLGYKGPLEPALQRAIQDAGVMHLLVPSGAKVAFFMGFWLWLSRRAGLGMLPRLLLPAAAGGFYVLIVGAEAPYLRAYLGAMAGYAAYLADRESGAFQALVLSALAILLAWPRSLFTAGFQMSYLAVLGLLIAFPRWRLPRRWPSWGRAPGELLLASAVVQAMLWPVFARYFGRGSLVGALANVPLVPCSGLLMGWGFAVWGLSFVRAFAPAGVLFAAAAAGLGRLAGGFMRLCTLAASVPCAAVDISPMSRLGLAAYYLGVLGCLLLPRWGSGAKAFAACAALLLARTVLGGPKPAGLSALVLARRGSWAVLVRLADGKRLFIDGGLAPSAAARALKAEGVSGFDVLFDRSSGRRRIDLPKMFRPSEIYKGNMLPGFRRRWAGADIAAGTDGALDLRFSRFQAHFPRPAAGLPEFCILEAPVVAIPGACSSSRRFTAGRDGATRAASDGEDYEINAQKIFR